MEKTNRAKYLLKNTIIFTLGNFASKFISFFLVPLYTNILSASEYGTVDLVVTISTITVPIITLNIMEAVMRFNLDRETDKNKITKIGILILFFGILLGIVLIPSCRLWNQVSSYSILIYLYVVCSAASQVFLCDLRGKELLIQYSIGNILNTVLIAGFNILFLLVFKLGISGYLSAYIIANAVVAVYALIIGKGYKAINAPLDTQKMKEMLEYSVVLIPNSFMWWIMNSSDHVMITSMIGVAANGIYAISYKLPTLISTFTGIFNQAWSYSAIREENAEDVESYTNNVFKSMISIIMLIGLCMMAFIRPFLNIYVSPNFYAAWQYTPFLIIGCVYLTLATFISTSYTVHKDSKGFLISATFGALLNIILNWTLIPILEVYGAALSTCISYISVFIFRLFHTRKYIIYRVMTKEFLLGSIGLVLSTMLMFLNSYTAQVFQVCICLLAVYVFKETWLPYIKMLTRKIEGNKI